MQEGRAAKAAERRSAVDSKRAAYSAWVKADAENFRRYRSGEINQEQRRQWTRSNPMPPLPSSRTEEDDA